MNRFCLQKKNIVMLTVTCKQRNTLYQLQYNYHFNVLLLEFNDLDNKVENSNTLAPHNSEKEMI